MSDTGIIRFRKHLDGAPLSRVRECGGGFGRTVRGGALLQQRFAKHLVMAPHACLRRSA